MLWRDPTRVRYGQGGHLSPLKCLYGAKVSFHPHICQPFYWWTLIYLILFIDMNTYYLKFVSKNLNQKMRLHTYSTNIFKLRGRGRFGFWFWLVNYFAPLVFNQFTPLRWGVTDTDSRKYSATKGWKIYHPLTNIAYRHSARWWWMKYGTIEHIFKKYW